MLKTYLCVFGKAELQVDRLYVTGSWE